MFISGRLRSRYAAVSASRAGAEGREPNPAAGPAPAVLRRGQAAGLPREKLIQRQEAKQAPGAGQNGAQQRRHLRRGGTVSPLDLGAA